ncbi:MAG: flagellar FliJ family protein [bacterium]
MAKFIYKFEPIKNIKRVLEKKVQKDIYLIELEIIKTNQMLEGLEKEKKYHKEKILQTKNLKALDLRFHSYYEKFIEEKILTIKKIREQFEKKKKEKLLELIQRSKETKIFEKLEEKYKLNFEKEQNRLEQIEIDDIATKKFIRGQAI